jgi:hypothetical protein
MPVSQGWPERSRVFGGHESGHGAAHRAPVEADAVMSSASAIRRAQRRAQRRAHARRRPLFARIRLAFSEARQRRRIRKLRASEAMLGINELQSAGVSRVTYETAALLQVV